MRGADVTQERLFSYVTPSDFVPESHPLRAIREIVNTALREMEATFAVMYAESGRESIPPEQLLRGLILQSLYGLRSERLLCEQLGYNLLFRWFVGLSMDDPIWDHSVFSKNRDRLLAGDIAQAFFDEVLAAAKTRRLLSDDHFTVDGTLLEAWASHKSVRQLNGFGEAKVASLVRQARPVPARAGPVARPPSWRWRRSRPAARHTVR